MAKKSIRPIRIEGNIAYVSLTRGYEAIIDAADVPLIAGKNWSATVDRNTVYASRTDHSGPKRKYDRLHRVLVGDCAVGLEVDHKDGNGLNNRRSNLRVATHQQNAHNRVRHANNTSGFKGVSFHKRDCKWRAEIKVHGKKRHLGYFATPEAAYAAYVEASSELHGDFGRAA